MAKKAFSSPITKLFIVLTLILFTLQSIHANGKMDTTEADKPKPTPAPKYKLQQPEGEVLGFNETWGYVTQNREDEYNINLPVTDVCYFAADFNCYGEMIDIPKRSKLTVAPDSRCHMVVICDSRSLTHFVISPEYSVKENAIKQMVEAAAEFDGLQLDFELVPARDGPAFMSFVKDCKAELEKTYGIGEKMFTMCVPARIKLLQDDIFPYEELSKICDRIFVMAYDEHWATSKPGAIASVEWCKKIIAYAQSTVPAEKLIIGIPFYGRTWITDKSPAGAWYFTTLNRNMAEKGIKTVTYEDDIPTFNYTATVNVTGYFNDTYSLVNLSRIYLEEGLQNLGFWRIGQEDPDFWNWIKIEPSPTLIFQVNLD